MPEDTREETITFIIDIPRDRIEELKQALEGLVTFDPNEQVVAFNDAIRSQPVAMGHHLPEMVLGINRRLDEEGLTPRIPEDHEKWSTLRRQVFLQFAMENFDWNDNMINQEWWVEEEIDWEDLATRYPMVSGEQKA